MMAYFVYHSFRNLSFEALTKKYNNHFKTSISYHSTKQKLKKLSTEEFFYYLQQTYQHSWSTAYPQTFEPPSHNLSFKHWSTEERVFIVLYD